MVPRAEQTTYWQFMCIELPTGSKGPGKKWQWLKILIKTQKLVNKGIGNNANEFNPF